MRKNGLFLVSTILTKASAEAIGGGNRVGEERQLWFGWLRWWVKEDENFEAVLGDSVLSRGWMGAWKVVSVMLRSLRIRCVASRADGGHRLRTGRTHGWCEARFTGALLGSQERVLVEPIRPGSSCSVVRTRRVSRPLPASILGYSVGSSVRSRSVASGQSCGLAAGSVWSTCHA
jgi:hypothetical protein